MFKRKKKFKKPNCEKDGHDYKIVEYIRRVNMEKNPRKPTGITILVECKDCNKRGKITCEENTGNQLTQMWIDGDITFQKKEELSELTNKQWEEYQKEYSKKSKKKTAKKRKKNVNQ